MPTLIIKRLIISIALIASFGFTIQIVYYKADDVPIEKSKTKNNKHDTSKQDMLLSFF